jgi:hypothetical protein
MVAALAGALALAGIGADAVTFVSRVNGSRHGRTRQEQGGGSGGDSGTRLRGNLHERFSKRGFAKNAPTAGQTKFRPADLHPAKLRLRFALVTRQTKIFFQSYLVHGFFDCKVVSVGPDRDARYRKTIAH